MNNKDLYKLTFNQTLLAYGVKNLSEIDADTMPMFNRQLKDAWTLSLSKAKKKHVKPEGWVKAERENN